MPIVRITPTIANEYANRCPDHIPDHLVEGWNTVTQEQLMVILEDAKHNSDPKAFSIGPDDMPLHVHNAYKALVKQILAQPTEDQLVVGRTFASKRPKTCGLFERLLDDRQIIHINLLGGIVQYDSPTVANGRHYPKVSVETFLRWAGADVTDKMPKGEWRRG